MKMRAGCDVDKYRRRWTLVLDEEKRKWFEQRQKERCGCSGADIFLASFPDLLPCRSFGIQRSYYPTNY